MRVLIFSDIQNHELFEGLDFQKINAETQIFFDKHIDHQSMDGDFAIIDSLKLEDDMWLKNFKWSFPINRSLVVSTDAIPKSYEIFLKQGFDDVVYPPFTKGEIVLRAKKNYDSQLQRIEELTRPGLTLKQLQIFELLKFHGPHGITREEIMKYVWAQNRVSPKNVDVQMVALRKELMKENRHIEYQKNRWVLHG